MKKNELDSAIHQFPPEVNSDQFTWDAFPCSYVMADVLFQTIYVDGLIVVVEMKRPSKFTRLVLASHLQMVQLLGRCRIHWISSGK